MKDAVDSNVTSKPLLQPAHSVDLTTLMNDSSAIPFSSDARSNLQPVLDSHPQPSNFTPLHSNAMVDQTSRQSNLHENKSPFEKTESFDSTVSDKTYRLQELELVVEQLYQRRRKLISQIDMHQAWIKQFNLEEMVSLGYHQFRL